MSKVKGNDFLPELRFTQVDGSAFPKWELVKLKAVAKRKLKKNKDESIIRVLTNSAVDGVVDQRDYFDKDIAVKGNLGGYYIVDKGDYVYNPRVSATAPVGPISKNNLGQGVMSPLYTVFHFNEEKNAYYEQFFKTSKWHNYLKAVSNTGARHDRMSISADEFLAMPIPVPDEKEQQKIADCLSSIDELIIAHTQKLDALKTHKKGLMQQLFPAEGETVPKLRFPGFEGEWTISPLSRFIASLDAGVSVNSGDKTAKSNEFGILKTSAVTNGVFEPTENKFVFDDNEISRLKEPVRKNTIIISRMNTPALVGANAYINSSFENLYLPDRLWAAKPKKDTELRFIASILGSDSGRKMLSAKATGTSDSMKNITKPDVLRLNVSAPKYPEQHKIAEFLSSIDELIAAQNKKIDSLKNHKKGLMQQLFPSLEGVDL